MGQQKSLADQKWAILLESSRKFVALAKFRKEERDYMEAVSVLNETLMYVTPQAFKGSPHYILKAMLQLNIQIYLQLADTFVQLKKYQAAKGCLHQVFQNDEQNQLAKQLLQRIKQQQKKIGENSSKLLQSPIDQNTC